MKGATDDYLDLRCTGCGALLVRYGRGSSVEAKCRKCNRVVHVRGDAPDLARQVAEQVAKLLDQHAMVPRP